MTEKIILKNLQFEFFLGINRLFSSWLSKLLFLEIFPNIQPKPSQEVTSSCSLPRTVREEQP